MHTPAYIQREGRTIETGGIFTRVMAIALDPRSGYADGMRELLPKAYRI